MNQQRQERDLDHGDLMDTRSSDQTSDSSNYLPSGWRTVSHLSGLVCYLQEHTGVVVWTKPYTVSGGGHVVDLEKTVKMHHPPLEIFAEGSGVCQLVSSRTAKMTEADGMYDIRLF